MDSNYGVISSRSVKRVSLVVLLIDDLTGKTITGSNARVWIDGEKPPVKKNDGFNVFLNLSEGDHEVKAEGGFYSQTSVTCRVDDGKYRTVNIRLSPNSLYPVPPDCIRIEGTAAPDKTIVVYSQDKGLAYKLLSDAKKGTDIVGIYHDDSINIEGKLLKIIASGGKGEFIRVSAGTNKEKSEYQLTGKLTEDYPKVGTIIVPAFRATADNSGKFSIILKNSFTKDSQITCETDDGKKAKSKTFSVGDSKYIKLEL